MPRPKTNVNLVPTVEEYKLSIVDLINHIDDGAILIQTIERKQPALHKFLTEQGFIPRFLTLDQASQALRHDLQHGELKLGKVDHDRPAFDFDEYDPEKQPR